MNARQQKQVDAVTDAIGWILEDARLPGDSVSASAVNAVNGVNKNDGLVLINAKALDSVRRTLEAIATRSNADVQTVMWAKQGLKTLDKASQED